MQGEWDLDKLANLTTEFNLDLNDLGFSSQDAAFLFDGDERFTELYDTPEAEIEKGKLEEIKNVRAESKERLKEKNNADFYAVIVFSNDEEKKEFLKSIHVPPTEQYITVNQVKRLLE